VNNTVVKVENYNKGLHKREGFLPIDNIKATTSDIIGMYSFQLVYRAEGLSNDLMTTKYLSNAIDTRHTATPIIEHVCTNGRTLQRKSPNI